MLSERSKRSLRRDLLGKHDWAEGRQDGRKMHCASTLHPFCTWFAMTNIPSHDAESSRWFPWFVLAVVVPSLLLSGFSFWALRQQIRFSQFASRQRATVVLSEAVEAFQTELGHLKTQLLHETPTEGGIASDTLLGAQFILDAAGGLLLPSSPSPPRHTPSPDIPEWRAAQQLEFALHDFRGALAVYRELDSPHARIAAARCAQRTGDLVLAQRELSGVATQDSAVPLHLRLGAYLALAEFHMQESDSRSALQVLLAGNEWLSTRTSEEDYQTGYYYRERFTKLWEQISASDRQSEIVHRWQQANTEWEARFAPYRLHAFLTEHLLPLVWPQILALPPGETRYLTVQDATDWHVMLVSQSPSNLYLGALLMPSAAQTKLMQILDARLQQLGENAHSLVVQSGESVPESALALLRMPLPWSAWQVAVMPSTDTRGLTQWQTSWFVWAIVLCAATILGGVYWLLRRMHQTQELSRLKTDFVSNVSHELKTPLTSIRLFVETLRLKRYDQPAQADEYLNILQQEVERLTRLVDRALSYSRMERGHRQYDFVAADLGTVVREACQVFEQQMEDDETCELTLQIPASLPSLKIDPDAVAEIVWNLLSNAVKYSHEPRRIQVQVTEDAGAMKLAVTDNGIGISRREQRQVFERFYRANDTLSREVEGSGLGLAIAKHIAEAHNAVLSVDSSIGKGSTFTVSFPKATDAP